jgi:hypothetical protein
MPIFHSEVINPVYRTPCDYDMRSRRVELVDHHAAIKFNLTVIKRDRALMPVKEVASGFIQT